MIGGAVDRAGSWWNRGLDRLDRLQRATRPSAFLFAVFRKFLDDRGNQFGALIAYYGLLSIFPLMVVLLTVLGFVLDGQPELRDQIEELALSQFPSVGSTIADNTSALSGDGSTLVIGLIGTLWAGLAATNAAGVALNAVFDVPRFRRPNPIERRIRGLGMIGVLGLGLLGSTIASVSSRVVDDLALVHALYLGAGSIVVNTFVYALGFRTLVDERLKWSTVVPGAAVAGTVWWLLTKLGGWYVEATMPSSQSYGAIAGAIALLAWFYVQGQVTVLSAEINVVLKKRLWPRSLTGRNLTEADLRALHLHLETERLVPGLRVEVGVEPERPGAAIVDPDDGAGDGDRAGNGGGADGPPDQSGEGEVVTGPGDGEPDGAGASADREPGGGDPDEEPLPADR